MGEDKRALALFGALLCAGCSRPAPDVPVRVSNLTVGLMREASDGDWHVYSQGHTFRLVPNGNCVVAGKDQPCMWYGFEFDYELATPDQVLICQARFNKPTDLVGPDQVESEDAADSQFGIALEGRKGHYAQIASVFRQPDDTADPWTVEVSCRHDQREVIHLRFTALHES